jgi:hypothetical protein
VNAIALNEVKLEDPVSRVYTAQYLDKDLLVFIETLGSRRFIAKL